MDKKDILRELVFDKDFSDYISINKVVEILEWIGLNFINKQDFTLEEKDKIYRLKQLLIENVSFDMNIGEVVDFIYEIHYIYNVKYNRSIIFNSPKPFNDIKLIVNKLYNLL